MAEPNFHSFGPMEGHGAEMDLLSGYPAEVSRQSRVEREEQRQRSRDALVWRLLQDLQGPGGEVARRVLSLAVERMHELYTSDPKLIILFDTLGDAVLGEIRQGDRFAREIALECCAMLLRLPSTNPQREPQREEGER